MKDPIRDLIKTRTFGAIFLALIALAVAAPSAPALSTYTTCYIYADHPRKDRVCSIGSAWGTVFVARRQDRVRYKLCVRRPTGDRDCFRKRTRRAGTPSVIGLFGGEETPGRYRFSWRVRGRVVDRDTFRLLIGD